MVTLSLIVCGYEEEISSIKKFCSFSNFETFIEGPVHFPISRSMDNLFFLNRMITPEADKTRGKGS
jgi:hypothetical protein